ncbi:MAG: OmpA family protein [Labilithrix sp.]|nr:OmpA family protein [Labilithrix sp.]
MRSVIVSLACLLAVGCGVPRSQYDAALADASARRRACDDEAAAKQKRIDELEAKIAEAEGKAGAADEATRAELEELRRQKAAADARLKLFEDFLAKFKKMIEAGKLDITVRRGQIVLALGTDILFDTGKTEIKPEGKAALGEVADVLKSVSGRRFQVAGHTDTVPIKTKEFASNWELSTARALAVIKLLIDKGVRPDTLSAAGYAELDPAHSNATEAGKAKNRRIEIVIVPNIEDLVKMPELAGKAKPSAPPKPPVKR